MFVCQKKTDKSKVISNIWILLHSLAIGTLKVILKNQRKQSGDPLRTFAADIQTLILSSCLSSSFQLQKDAAGVCCDMKNTTILLNTPLSSTVSQIFNQNLGFVSKTITIFIRPFLAKLPSFGVCTKENQSYLDCFS